MRYNDINTFSTFSTSILKIIECRKPPLPIGKVLLNTTSGNFFSQVGIVINLKMAKSQLINIDH